MSCSSKMSLLRSSIVAVITFVALREVSGATYQHPLDAKPVYQPELDGMNLESYASDQTLFDLLIKCLLYDGLCDPVGKWMRPRMASYFLESCPLCTPNQELEVERFISWLSKEQPQLFLRGVSKYLDANGITLPRGSKFRSRVEAMNVPKLVTPSSSKEATSSSEESDASPVSSSGPSKSSRIAPEEPLEETLKTGDDDDSVLTTPAKTLSSNSRRNKFSPVQQLWQRRPSGSSASTSLFGHPQKVSNIPSTHEEEDDEAESDFEITTLP